MSNRLMLELWEVKALGFKTMGGRIQISRQALIINPGNISLGSNIRIDAFSIISAGDEGIQLGSHVHIAAGVKLFGGGGPIRFGNCTAISVNSTIFTGNDDYKEGYLSGGPVIPDKYRKLALGGVELQDQVMVGAGSNIFPGVVLEYGSMIGAMSMVTKGVPEGRIAAGIPAQLIGYRQIDKLMELEQEFYAEEALRIAHAQEA